MLFRHVPHIKSIGKSIFDPVWAAEFHAGPNTEVLHIFKGRFEFQTKDYSISCREGDTIYVPAQVMHRDVFPPGSYFETYVVHLDWEDEAEMLSEYHPTQLIPSDPDIRRDIRKGFERMYRDFQKDIPGCDDFMGVQMLWIISAMCRDMRSSSDASGIGHDEAGHSRRVMIMEEARRIIHERYDRSVTLESIAAELNISTFYLSRVFSRESGFTLSDYLTHLRLERAAEMLAEPRLNIGEIARAVGFQDSRYFSQVFKSHYGQSPKAYRDAIPVGSSRT